MKAHARIINPERNDKMESMFWNVMNELNTEEKTKFLIFTTGLSQPPLNGFAYMQPTVSKRTIYILYRLRFDSIDMKTRQVRNLGIFLPPIHVQMK